MYDFHYHRPVTLAEASALIADCRDGVYLAGGQTLIATLKHRLARPSDVVDPGAIADQGTLDHPNRLAEGVRHTIVNGVPAFVDGSFTETRSGQVLRRAA